ncbi:hebe isoform 2-T2 [Cochliomyia hominivorax]
MADVNRPKIQLRPVLSINGDKTPSPATKLLINHGKPNFTIQKSSKTLNGNANPLSSPPANEVKNNNNNEFIVKSTTFNGVFKPSNISLATKQTLPQNGHSNNNNNNDVDNEAAKVILRRAKVVPTEVREGDEDENVPEFILRQRRIQERLANQNILDFENRRSGYFTQVMISPSSPNRQSFVETMASPAVKPGLEIPPPAHEQPEDIKEEVVQQDQQQQEQHEETEVDKETIEESVKASEPVLLNGNDAEEEEVAKAIEEVNKAVEGEDDDKNEVEEIEDNKQNDVVENHEEHQEETSPVVAVVTSPAVEQETPKEEPIEPANATVTSLIVEDETPKSEENSKEEEVNKVYETPLVAEVVEVAQQNGHSEHEVELPLTNGVEILEHEEQKPIQNDNSSHEITISHTNGLNKPTIPSPDPKGEKGVNFEPKTVVSFSQELGNDVNKYPDTVKVVKETPAEEVDSDLKELTKLKFEIKADDENIEVKPVLITETVAN